MFLFNMSRPIKLYKEFIVILLIIIEINMFLVNKSTRDGTVIL